MPKTRVQKESLLASYNEVVAKGNFVVVETDKVPAVVMTELRKHLAPVESKLFVIKNKVFAKAASVNEELGKQNFVGQLVVIEGGADIATAAKQIEQSVKEAKAALALTGKADDVVAKYTPFSFKFGYINGSVLNASDVDRLSKLPDKKTVLAMFVGTLAAPLTSFMSVMTGVPRKFVYALNDLQNKKA
jgi:large subunit ribosomal protein L10